MTSLPVPSQFAPTRWTLVLAARGDTPEAQAALASLCESYWRPVFRFLVREGRDEETARELTQEFFARLLARRGVDGVDPERGRFRSYLLGALRHFLADVREKATADKRGGGQTLEPLEILGTDTTPGVEVAPPSPAVPDTWFDRQWAYAVMERALSVVGAEFHSAGRDEQFTVLKAWLVGDTPSLSSTEASRRLGLSEGAVKVAIHRLRRRFREVIRAEVTQTVGSGSSVEEELQYLIEVLTTG